MNEVITMPAWLSAVMATVAGGGFLGLTAWLFTLGNRVSVAENDISYVKGGIDRIEKKLDRLIDDQREV